MDNTHEPRPSAAKPLLAMMILFVCTISLLGYVVQGLFSSPAARVEGPTPSYRADSPDVVLFATSWCGYCAKAREYFQEHGIAYLELDIEENEDAEEEHDVLGGRGVPVILIKDKILHGWSEAALTQTLQTAGLLE